MTTVDIRYRSRMPASAEDVFDWHARDGAFERLAPPWQRIRVLTQNGGITERGRLEFELKAGPFGIRWLAQHGDYEPGHHFTDWQEHGPFAEWLHAHRFISEEDGTSILEDHIRYRLPFGRVGNAVAGRSVRSMLREMFRFRHLRTRMDLLRHASIDHWRPLRIAVTGGSGTIGSQLVPFLTAGGHQVVRLVRYTASAPDEVYWNPGTGEIDASRLDGLDAVVHLAGESIAGLRWSQAKRGAILRSRVDGTRLLSETVARLEHPPGVLISASGIDYYGDTAQQPVDETGPAGISFLSEVCAEWEAATKPASNAGIRTVPLRLGLVLSGSGGLLPYLLVLFKLGLGGTLRGGEERYASWIDLDDVLGVINHALFDRTLDGPVNVVSPRPVTQLEFTRVLGSVVNRPAWITVPSRSLEAVFSKPAADVLLTSHRIQGDRIIEAGYRFGWPDIESSLRYQLGRQFSSA